jgi:hemerythrin-like domain-containing protein
MKRRSELRDLSDDHHTALVIARSCKRAASLSDAERSALSERLRVAFETHLEPHFEIEERYLLPALERLGERVLLERLQAEHADLRARAAGAGDSADCIVAFGERLESHVRFEERVVFEQTQDRLAEAELAAILEASARVPRSCASEWFGEAPASAD